MLNFEKFLKISSLSGNENSVSGIQDKTGLCEKEEVPLIEWPKKPITTRGTPQYESINLLAKSGIGDYSELGNF